MTFTERDPLFDSRISDWLEQDRNEAPRQVLETVVAAMPAIPQRRRSPVGGSRWWPAPGLPLVAAALAGALVVGVLAWSVGIGRTSVGTPTISEPGQPTARPTATPPSLDALFGPTKRFFSPRHGYNIRYPVDWTVRPATAPWAHGTVTNYDDPALDVFETADARLAVASQPLVIGENDDAWLQAYCRTPGSTGGSCETPIQIGNRIGRLREAGSSTSGGTVVGGVLYDAAVVADRRGYEFTLDGRVTRDQFVALLAMVSFDPGSASYLPALTGTFTSPNYGYTIAIGDDITVVPATGKFDGGDPVGPSGDRFSIDGSTSTVGIAAQRLRADTEDEVFDWIDHHYAALDARSPGGCDATSTRHDRGSILLGSITGTVAEFCSGAEVVAWIGYPMAPHPGSVVVHNPTAYVISLLNPHLDDRLSIDDFQRWLATVKLDPSAIRK